MTTSTPRREVIATTAARLFAERGFHAVSINDIGRAVGTSGPALYRHFPSKEALLGRLLTDISDALLAGAQQRTGLSGTSEVGTAQPSVHPHEVLRSLVRWHLDFTLNQPDLIVVQDRDMASLASADSARVRRTQRAYVELWVDAVRAALGDDLEVRRVRSAVHAVFGMLNSTPHSTHLPAAQMADLLERMALAALGALRDNPGPAAVSSTDSADGRASA